MTYVHDVDGASNVWRFPLEGGPPRPVTRFKAGDGLLFEHERSADGRQLFMTRGEDVRDVVVISNFT